LSLTLPPIKEEGSKQNKVAKEGSRLSLDLRSGKSNNKEQRSLTVGAPESNNDTTTLDGGSSGDLKKKGRSNTLPLTTPKKEPPEKKGRKKEKCTIM